MNNEPVILMVEDETDVLRINARLMTRRGCRVLCAETYAAALQLLERHTPDLLILDIMLPDGSGYDLCQRFRAVSDHPVIFLTGKTDLADRIDGLHRGGDYYLTKPYDPDELMAVAQRLLQRHMETQKNRADMSVITRGSLSLNIPKSRAEVCGRDAGLTAKEFALLLLLVRSEGKELTADLLYKTVWDTSAEKDTRTVRTHINNLRRKLGAENTDDFDILSVYGKGYTFVCNESDHPER